MVRRIWTGTAVAYHLLSLVQSAISIAKIMSFLKYLKPVLPSPAQTGIGESATAAANKEVEKSTERSTSRKRKQYVTYMEED